MNITTIIISMISSLGGAAGITFALIRLFGNRLLESQFEKSLESYKYRINSRFDRISKIHEKEFEILPIIWRDLIQTNSNFYLLTSQLQSHADLNNMNELERKEFYENNCFKNSIIEKIEKSSDKTEEFIKIEYWQKYSKISIEYNQFAKDFMENRIFLTKAIDIKIEEIRKKFISMLSILDSCYQNGKIDYKFKMDATNEQKRIIPLIDDVGALIQERLCFAEAYEK